MGPRLFTFTLPIVVAAAATGCTLLANGKINRTAQVDVPRGAPGARLVIEDLEQSIRSIDGLLEIRTPLEGRASQIVFTAADPREPCFVIDDYQGLDQLAMLQGNPYADMDFKLERSDGATVTKYRRSELHDEHFDVAFVVQGGEEDGFQPRELSNKLLRAQATVCFTSPEPFVTADTAWIKLRAGVSKYTFNFR
jgi:hypothetical protein